MVAYTVKILMYYLLLRSGSAFRRSSITVRSNKGYLADSQSLLRRVITSMADISDSAVADSLAMLSPAIETVKKEPPNAMLSHLRTRIVWALETWHGGDGIDANMRDDIAGNVVDAIIRKREANATDGDTREQNKMLVNYGQIVAKAIRATPGSIQELKDDINVLDSTINTYQLHLEKNRAVYININRHHESLVKKSYSAAVQNVTSLEVYAEAANSMGKKVWVQQGNLWMEDFSINFFRRNGARKDYLKAINHDPNREGQREMATALPRDLMLEETFLKDTEENSNSVNMLETDSPPARLIRLVDVGSCYNPIGKSANQAAFSVTPLDLCPVDPSVYQCDFLDLEIGPKGSVPVIVSAATTVQEHSENITAVSSGTENGPEKSTESKSPKLLRLPAASYDAVAMSLVLNYLPTPALREKMIKKARQLLIPPGEGGQPHRAGILLIIEKESIFSYDRIQSDVYHNKSTLLNCWKETICSLGFELVRYRNILTTEDHRRCHALAFRTIQIPEQTAESSIEISEEHSAEHSAITEPSEASTSTTTNSSGIRYTDQLMLAKSLANKKLFEAGKSGMWIKQDFSSGPTEKKNNYNRNYKDLQDTFAVNQKVLEPTEGDNNADGDGDADADGSDGDSVGGWDADGLGVISGKAKTKTKASSTVTPTSIDNTIKSNTNSNSNCKSASTITLPVAIVGGGLGGCALALALQRKGIPYVMYEKDSHFASRKQGYALTLQQGGASLRMLGLEGEYKTRGVPSLAHESYASDGTLLGAYGASVRKGLLLEDTVVSVRDGAEEEMDRDELCDSAVVDMIAQGNVLEMKEDGVHYMDETMNQGVKEVKELKETGGKKSIRRLEKAQSRHNVHISRQQLRDLLMSNISPSSVVWGKSFSHFIEKDDSVEVCFQDGSSVDASVLVAADGIYSTVRKQLIPQSEDQTKSLSKGLNYLGLMVILGISPVVIGAKASVTIPPPCDQPSFSETGVKSTGESSGSIPSFDSITMTADHSTDIDTATATGTGNEERVGTSKKRRIEDSVVVSDYRQPTTAGSSSSSLPPIENIESTVLPRSQCQWLDGSTRVFTMPFDRSHTMWQLSFPCTEEEALILASNPTLLKQKALEQCAGWHGPLVTLLSVTELGMVSGHPAYDRDPLKISDMLRKAPSSCDSDSTGREKGNRSGKKQQQHQHKNRPLTQSTITSTTSNSNATSSSSDNNSISNSSSDRPDETTSAPQGSPVRALKRVPFCRVTLLGDAAHPMSPFKAQGANQALLDALCLSTALVSSELAKAGRRSLSDALDSYEQEMSVRSAVKVLKSRAAAVSLHSPSALATGNETRASVAENALII